LICRPPTQTTRMKKAKRKTSPRIVPSNINTSSLFYDIVYPCIFIQIMHKLFYRFFHIFLFELNC
jgi:hypothetical protein